MTHSKVMKYAPLVGRVLIGLLFLISGFGILMNISGTAGFYASIGIPMAMVAAIIVMAIKIGGSLMIITGMHARTGAWALLVFTVLATLIGHTGEGQMVMALKNLSIVGGLLYVIAYGSGAFSLADKCPCPKCKEKKASVSAAGGVCNCGNCNECRKAKAADMKEDDM